MPPPNIPPVEDQSVPPPVPVVSVPEPTPTPPPSGSTPPPPPPTNDQPVKTAKVKWGAGKIILSVVGVIVLVAGLGIGVNLARQRQLLENQAAPESCPGSAVCNIPGQSETFCKDNNVWTHNCLSNSCWDATSEQLSTTCSSGQSCINTGANQAQCQNTGGTGGLCGSDPVNWCATFQCPNGDTDGDGTCNPTPHGSYAGDTGATYTTHSGSSCSAPTNCGQVDYYRAGPEGQNWDAYCTHQYLKLTDCGTGTPTSTPTASPTPTRIPTSTPTPIPTPTSTPIPGAPLCSLTVNPTTFTFMVGGAAQTLNVTVAPESGATVTGVAFAVTGGASSVSINPSIDLSAPYSTQVTPLAAGNSTISILGTVTKAGVTGTCAANVTVVVNQPAAQCQQIAIIRAGQTISKTDIHKGDSLIFRASAGNAISRQVANITFQLTKDGVAQAEVVRPATYDSTSQTYLADYAVDVTTAGSYSVTVTDIEPVGISSFPGSATLAPNQ